MKKDDILEKLEELNLPSNEYWILAGSSLVMHQIKEETCDIDMGCTKELFDIFIEKGFKVKEWEDGGRSINLTEEIEIFKEWNVTNIELINGFPVASLESIKEHKLELGREKDLKDIELIDSFLAKK